MNRAVLESLDKEALIQLALAQAEMIAGLAKRIEDLEARLGPPPKTPKNSSVPPSKGQKASSGEAAKPKSKVHPGAHRPLHPDPTRKLTVKAATCPCCQGDVSDAPQFDCHSYDHIDIPPVQPQVTRITLQGGICPHCAGKFRAPAPEEMQPGSPFGPNLRALVLYLRFAQCISLERLRRTLLDLFGLEISEGALVNMIKASAPAFSAQVASIRDRLLSGTILASDETTMRVGKVNYWLWVFHHADCAVFDLDRQRARRVVEEFLGDFRPQYWLSDRYGAQMNWSTGDHQVCLSHLIRDAQYVIDCGDTILAPAFKKLLQRACAIGQRRPELSDASLKRYLTDFDARLDKILERLPTHAAGIKFKTLIPKIRRHLFVFLTVRALEPTNNGSERALRPSAIYRKVTNGFRSIWAGEHYADFRSVIETGRRRTITAIDAIRFTLRGITLPLAAALT